MQLGPIQKAWVKNLREHPERQTSCMLGLKCNSGEDTPYLACCLGEALLTLHRMKDGNDDNAFVFDEEYDEWKIMDGRDGKCLGSSWERLGLRDPSGEIFEDEPEWEVYNSLAEMNDAGISWPEIADFIEENPETVFTKSV